MIELSHSFVCVKLSSRSKAATLHPLYVRGNAAYVLLLDATGAEVDRFRGYAGTRIDGSTLAEAMTRVAAKPPKGRRRVALLRSLLTNADMGTRWDALWFVRTTKAAEAIPDLLATLERPNPRGPRPEQILRALGEFGALAKSAVPRIAKILDDPKQPLRVRQTAALVLGRLVADPKARAAFLKRAAADENAKLREAAELAREGTAPRAPEALAIIGGGGFYHWTGFLWQRGDSSSR